MVSIFYNMVSRDPRTKVHEIREISDSVSWPDLYWCQISLCHDKKKMWRYPLSKICAPGKVDQSSAKSLKICYAPMPPLWQISSRSAKRSTRKALTILLHIWRPRGAPGSKFTDLGTDVQQGSLKFRPFVTAYRRDYLLPNFVDFIESVTDRYYYYTVTTTTACLKQELIRRWDSD